EELLRRLAPPKSPEEILGRIDRNKAAAGAKLFVENCSGTTPQPQIRGFLQSKAPSNFTLAFLTSPWHKLAAINTALLAEGEIAFELEVNARSQARPSALSRTSTRLCSARAGP